MVTGIKFEQYDSIKVERSGADADSIPELDAFASIPALPP